MVFSGLFFLFLATVVFLLFMYFNQNNIIYVTEVNGMKYPENNPHPFKSPTNLKLDYKKVSIHTEDGETLAGWLVYKGNTPKKTLIYFHENAGNIGLRLPFIKYIIEVLEMNCLIVGYRGYGHSTGTPSEEGLKKDGKAVVSWAFTEEKEIIDKENIFLFGRSLGGAVVAYLAANVDLPFKGIIIENTFTTMGEMTDVIYPILKYLRGFLLKSKWETVDIINKIKKPLMFMRSENDELIPKWQMDKLFDLATSAKIKDRYVIKKGTHNEGYLMDREGYKQAFLEFIEKCN